MTDTAKAATVDPLDAVIIERLDAAGLLDVPRAECEPSPGLAGTMAGIAKLYRAVEYDAGDRPAERAAVIVAATRAGLVPVPSDTITPRTIRGCTLPAAQPSVADLLKLGGARPTAEVRAELMAGFGLSPQAAAELAVGDGTLTSAGDIAVEAALDAIRPILVSLFNGGRTIGRASAKASQ